MDNENNNADFNATVEEVHPRLVPAPDLTLPEFVDKAKNLLDDMAADFAEHVGDEEPHDWDYWVEQLTNSYVNS